MKPKDEPTPEIQSAESRELLLKGGLAFDYMSARRKDVPKGSDEFLSLTGTILDFVLWQQQQERGTAVE